MMDCKHLIALAGIGAVLINDACASPQTGFEGKTLRIVVGYAAGTEYDHWARLIGRHIGRHLKGTPSVVVENMPGAGSIKATSYLFAQAPKDGTVIGAIGRDVITLPLTNPTAGSRFEALKFGWLGSPTTETNACVGNAAAGLRTARDLFAKELIVGGTGAGTGTAIYPRVLNGFLGTKFKITDGYKSSTEVLLAMKRREVDGICQSYSYISGQESKSISDGSIVVLLQGGIKPNPQLKGVTFARDLATTPEQLQGIDFLYSSQAYARPFITPPDLPKAVLASLRDAFDATMKDPRFVAEADKLKMDIDPISGQEVELLVKKAYATPAVIIERLRAILKSR
jgi:tripartite-type tricarboxylate transporter receptor subunit TctC